ncbi:MAG: cob(I)yrinic acid a,c-diamide adenosyltransferase [Dehalococcoidia bacterium]|nr:MAG: cob(I)yrinic acid a,c-diamide adenosyltransferase [Dehalococcoidia bacterium]
MVAIFTGDGKGKTTAAIGTVVRAAGHGFRACIICFLKGKDYIHGENSILSKLPNVTLTNFGQAGWVNRENINPEHKKQAGLALAAAKEAINSDKYDIIVLDEINITIDLGLIDLDKVIKLIKDRPKKMELILTGRYANPKLLQMADLVTEMKNIKHPFMRGVTARRGIDY